MKSIYNILCKYKSAYFYCLLRKVTLIADFKPKIKTNKEDDEIQASRRTLRSRALQEKPIYNEILLSQPTTSSSPKNQLQSAENDSTVIYNF